MQSEGEETVANVTVTQQGPVTVARLRADELLVQFRGVADQLGATLTAAVAELSTLADPAVAEAQVQAVQADAARRIAEAEMATVAAEQRRREAEDARAAAEEAAEDAVGVAEGADARIAEALAARDDALRELERVTKQAADEVFAARSEAEAEIRTVRRETAEEVERIREQAREEIELARSKAAAEIEQVRREAGQRITAAGAERDLAVQRAADAERAIERAEQAVAERNQVVAETRVELERVRAELDAVRGELSEVRRVAAADVAAVRAEGAAALEKMRKDAEQRIAALDDARAQTLTRAERAERQLDALFAARAAEAELSGS